jgi:hypothetical protein
VPFAKNSRDSLELTFYQPVQYHQGNDGWHDFQIDGHEEYQGHAAITKDLIMYFLTF